MNAVAEVPTAEKMDSDDAKWNLLTLLMMTSLVTKKKIMIMGQWYLVKITKQGKHLGPLCTGCVIPCFFLLFPIELKLKTFVLPFSPEVSARDVENSQQSN